MEESEFGRGLIVCLVKFAEHFENSWLRETFEIKRYYEQAKNGTPTRVIIKPHYVEMFEKIELTTQKKFHPDRSLEEQIKHGISSKIHMWANGATDHLYEIIVPKKWENTTLGEKVKELREKGLEMGHGFDYEKLWTVDDALELQKLTREIALLIDQKIGLKKTATLGDF